MANSLIEVLKKLISMYLTLSNSDTTMYNEVLKSEVEKKLIESMKEVDPLFKKIYQNIYYAGSYYDGVRINEANEFDLNLRLNLPFGPNDFEIIHQGVPPGYVKYKLTKTLEELLAHHAQWDIYKKLITILDDTHMFLSQQKANQWLQGVVDKAKMTHPDRFRNFSRAIHGPATTLYIKTPNGKKLDVDLVPVVQLDEFPKSIRPLPLLSQVPTGKQFAFIVPKPTPDIPSNKAGTLWRVSMPEVEKYLIREMGCFKPLIKIFKAIRDRYQWKGIASYYIKTLFMYQAEKHPEAQYWNEARMGELFLMMIKEFISVIEKQRLDHFFFNNANLLSSLSKETATNIKGRLERILHIATTDVSKLMPLIVDTNAPRSTSTCSYSPPFSQDDFVFVRHPCNHQPSTSTAAPNPNPSRCVIM